MSAVAAVLLIHIDSSHVTNMKPARWNAVQADEARRLSTQCDLTHSISSLSQNLLIKFWTIKIKAHTDLVAKKTHNAQRDTQVETRLLNQHADGQRPENHIVDLLFINVHATKCKSEWT